MFASRLAHVLTGPARSNPFGRLVAQGSFYTAGMQLGSGAVVLPVICASQGLTWAAGLLYPAFCIGAIVGNSVSPLILQRAGQLRHLLMAAISATTAVLVLCNAAVPWTHTFVAAVFLITSTAVGAITGVSGVAYADMISSKLSVLRRGELLLTQGALGSVLATGVTLLVVPMLAGGDQMARYHDLLWLGAAGLAASGVAAVFVGPMRAAAAGASTRASATRVPFRDTYRQGFEVARTQPWFRRYVITYLLFAPISLGTTFFSLRAAQQRGNLQMLVVLSSIGLVIGSVLWRKVYRLCGVRGMLLGSALLSMAASLLCILAESCGQWFHMWAYGTVFLLATVASQAVTAAAVSWISALAAEQHRATLISFGSTLVAVEFTLLGAVLGTMAQKHATVWPVVAMLTLAAVAAVAALSAPARERAGAPAREPASRPQLAAHSSVVVRMTDVRLADGARQGISLRCVWDGCRFESFRPAPAAVAAA
nr:MFS transporter [Mycobacterium simiae]